ncbi:MAG TPA: hypothetical protein VG347_09400 [Verrucomicrobiae bacterium]|nr:hypothetical protein [Verrucomicrobiae bacterium]
MKTISSYLAIICSLIFTTLPLTLSAAPLTNADTTIHAPDDDSEIIIKTTSRTAGAIESLQWNGKEFLNSTDHGRELQAAWNGNAGIEPIADETFNPTEAGSLDDGAGTNSSSRLLEIQAHENQLMTFSQPAFWLNPGETSGGKPARNKTVVSNDRLRKQIVIGCTNLPHAIDCQLTVTLAPEDHNTRCVIEALTGYMPPEFDHFQVFNPKTGQLAPIDDGPGEQPLPLVFSTADGKYAMGVYSPSSETPRDATGPTYGRWNFKDFHVVKWNCVFRLQNPAGLSGDFHCHVFVAVGSLEDVRTTLIALQKTK